MTDFLFSLITLAVSVFLMLLAVILRKNKYKLPDYNKEEYKSSKRHISLAKKRGDYIIIPLDFLESLTREDDLKPEQIISIITNYANKTSNKPNIDALKREINVYEDDHFSIYQLLPNEFIFYIKDLEEFYCFEVKANYGQIDANGVYYDNVEDVIISMNGDEIMTFGGQDL